MTSRFRPPSSFYTIGLESLKSVSAASIAGRSLSASTMRTRRIARGPTQPWVSDSVRSCNDAVQLTIQASLPSNVFLQYPLYIYSVCMLMICFQFSVAVATQAIPPAHEPLPKPGDPPQPSSKARLASGVQMNSHSLPLSPSLQQPWKWKIGPWMSVEDNFDNLMLQNSQFHPIFTSRIVDRVGCIWS